MTIQTLISYFIPQVREIPILGLTLANDWLWTLNPSPAYVGQGIIMGPSTTLHMLIGAVLGWGILSPLAKSNGWAPGPVKDWLTGSRGWIVWVSLAIMLADSVVNLGWLALRPMITSILRRHPHMGESLRQGRIFAILNASRGTYAPLEEIEDSSDAQTLTTIPNLQTRKLSQSSIPEPDAPPHQLINNRISTIGFILSIVLCILAVHISFPSTIPLWGTILAVLFSLLLSIMGVRALGETDLNPVSGISKLTQLIFALLTPKSSPNAITINLLAGAISESAALQAGDMMQDLKTGHLLGASPKAQFYGQLIGSFIGAVSAALVYKLYISVYHIPNDLFQIPSAYVWIFTARLVTGQGLPEQAWEWAAGAGLIWCILTIIRITGRGKAWQAYIPGGIAVAVGIYNVPSFTLARTVGGLINAYWRHWSKREEAPIVVLASGLILGEGVVSIVNLVLTSLGVPHL